MGIDQEFREFHAENPHVAERLAALAWELRQKGHRKIGIGMLFEVLRWQTMMATTDPSGFKLNNSYRAFYARLLPQLYPNLRGMFDTRQQHFLP